MLIDDLEVELPVNGIINIKSDKDNNVLSSDDSQYCLNLRIDNISDPKEVTKFIKKCESLIRMSPEYKNWVAYIYEVLGLTECSVTKEHSSVVPTQIHHYPINLFTLVKAVINRHLFNNIAFCSFDIALEVIQLHFQLKLGFTVLITSMHEKHHNGALDLPIEIVTGDYNSFIQDYGQYIDEDELQTIKDRLKINYSNCGWNNSKYEWINYDK